ncbi:MFS transporter [Streptomyces sp. NBC_00876]|nr:MFS transporter [Streptomyces sp. NBC_00876]
MVIALAQVLVLLDAASFDLALPSLMADLGVSDNVGRPLFLGYTLSFGGLLLVGGHLADRLGRRRTFVTGLVGYAVASLLGGLPGGEGLLILARVLQGASAALLTPAALALVATGFTDPKERRRALGIFAAIAGGGSALGLLAGGWLTEFLTWRLSLCVGAGLAVLVLIGAAALVHERPVRTDARSDTGGMLLGTGGLLALGYGFAQADQHGWSSPLVLAASAVGTLLLAGFLWRRTVRTDPFPAGPGVTGLDRLGCFLAVLLAGFGVIASFVAVDYLLLVVYGYTPLGAGLAFVPMVAAVVIGSTQVSARLLPRVEPRVLIVSGLAITAVGLALLTRIEPGGAYVTQVLPGLLLTGFGTGLAFMPVLATATEAAGPELSGERSAAVTAGQQLGLTLGTVLLNTVVTGEMRHVASPGDVTAAIVRAYHTALWWAVGGTLLACLAAALLITVKAPEARTQDR